MATVLLAPAVFGRPMVATPGMHTPMESKSFARRLPTVAGKNPVAAGGVEEAALVGGCDQRRGVGQTRERSGLAAAGCRGPDDEATGQLT